MTNALSGPQSSHPPSRASTKPANEMQTEIVFCMMKKSCQGRAITNASRLLGSGMSEAPRNATYGR